MGAGGSAPAGGDAPPVTAPAQRPQEAIIGRVFYDRVVRTGGTWEAPLFVHKDVCAILGISKHYDAYARLEEYHKGAPLRVESLGGAQEMATLTEAGFYSLVLRSDKPAAKAFEKWVTTEVLPTIRRTGSYAARQAQLPAAPSVRNYRPKEDYADFASLLLAVLGDRESVTVPWDHLQAIIDQQKLFAYRRELLAVRLGEQEVSHWRWRSSISRYLQGFWNLPVGVPGGTLTLWPRHSGKYRIYAIHRSHGGAS